MSTTLSRRSFLAGMAGLSGALVACGGQAAGIPARSSTAVPSATAAGYAQPDMLVAAEELVGRLVERGKGPRVVAFVPRDEYDRGHLPGAVQIDWPELEITDTSERSLERWRADVQDRLEALGLSEHDEVVIYDHGSLFAARLWWVLHYLGHADKRVLNGGLAAWRGVGGEVSTQNVTPERSAYRGTPKPDTLADIEQVRASLDQPGVMWVDARSPGEYEAGHVPGAVNVQYTRNAVDGGPKFWRPRAELARMYEDAGVTREGKVIPYCTTGVRSAVTYFTLRLIGYEDAELFTGSWAEYSRHTDLPVER